MDCSCSIANQPYELRQRFTSKPCERAIDALCTYIRVTNLNLWEFMSTIGAMRGMRKRGSWCGNRESAESPVTKENIVSA